MPSDPSDTINNDPLGDSHTIQANDDSVSYNASYVKFAQPQPADEANFKTHRDAFLRHLPNCAIASETQADPELPSFIGRHYRLNCAIGAQKVTFIGNIYWGKHYGYAVMAMFAATQTDSPDVKKFVDSFALIDPAK